MDSKEFIQDMQGIKHELADLRRRLDENDDLRHKRNSEINDIIHEEMDTLGRLEKRVSANEISIVELRAMHAELISLLKGHFGRPGLVGDHADVTMRVGVLERWKTRQAGFVAGAVAVASLIGSGIGFVTALVFRYFHGS